MKVETTNVVKGVVKTAVGIGVSAIVGGLGGLALHTYTGVAHAVAKYTIPLASSVISRIIKKQTDPEVDEIVDEAAKAISVTIDVGTVAKAAVES